MLYKVVPTFESVDEILKCDNSNKSYWAVLSCSILLNILLYKVVLTFVYLGETQSVTIQTQATEQYFHVMLFIMQYTEDGSNFWVCGWNPNVWPLKQKLLSSTFLWCCLICCTRWF